MKDHSFSGTKIIAITGRYAHVKKSLLETEVGGYLDYRNARGVNGVDQILRLFARRHNIEITTKRQSYDKIRIYRLS